MGNSCSAQTFCEYNATLDKPILFQADPDVAGIGVITSFLISAWLTYAVALYTYCSIRDAIEDDSPYATRLDYLIFDHIDAIRNKVLNKALTFVSLGPLSRKVSLPTTKPYDFIFTRLRTLKGKFPWGNRTLVTKQQMETVCLMFADQQLVTGASILIVGYVRHCEITQYHFYIVSLLGLISFATFQSVVLIIRGRIKKGLKRGWRFAWVTVLFACALVTNFVIYNDNFLVEFHFGLPMHCLWIGLPGYFRPDQIPYVVFGTLVDVWSYLNVFSYLYPETNDVQPFAVLSKIVNAVTRAPAYLYVSVRKRNRSKLIQGVVYLLFLFSFTLRELVFSIYVDLVRVFTYLYQTTFSIGLVRRNATESGRQGEEDAWGFGQILPMLLLALPLLAFVEAVVSEDPETEGPSKGGMTRRPTLEAFNESNSKRTQEVIELETSMYDKKKHPYLLIVMIYLIFGFYAVVMALASTQTGGVPI